MGIALQYVKYPYPIVVDFKDFENVYLQAKAYREEHADDVDKDYEELEYPYVLDFDKV